MRSCGVPTLVLLLALLGCGGGTTGSSATSTASDSQAASSEGQADAASTAADSGTTTGSDASCGDGFVDPGEHCDGGLGCPANCVFPVGSEVWTTIVGPSATYLFGLASGRVGRGIAQTESSVVVAYLSADEVLAIAGLDASSGEALWEASIENVGEPLCMDCELPFVSRVVATPVGACAVGRAISYDPNSTAEGVVSCFGPTGAVVSQNRFAVDEYGPSTVVAAAVAPGGEVLGFGLTHLPEAADYQVTLDSSLQLDGVSALSVGQEDYAMLGDAVFGVNVDRVSSIGPGGDPELLAAFEGEQLGLIAATGAGYVATAGVREISTPREPIHRYLLVWHVIAPDGTLVDGDAVGGTDEVDFVSDLAWSASGSLFVLVRRSDDQRARLLDLGDGDATEVWASEGESMPGAIDATSPGFVSTATDAGAGATLETVVTRVAVSPAG